MKINRQDADDCLSLIGDMLRNQSQLEVLHIFLWYVSKNASFANFTETLQRIASNLSVFSLGIQSNGYSF